VAGGAELVVWRYWHIYLWVADLEGSMTGFTGNAFKGIATRCGIITSRVALEAGELRADLFPITLENG
jgi:hypothetical protein